MRYRIPTALLALIGSLPAQNNFDFYPQADSFTCTTFTTRAWLGTGAGELLMQYHDDVFRGIGNNGGTGLIGGMRVRIQDQDTSTQETFRFIIRADDGNCSPDPSAAGILYQSGPIQPPVGVGTKTWRLTITFPALVAVPCGKWYAGISLPAAPSWNTDGLSIHAADYVQYNTGDQPRVGSPNHCFQINAASVVSQGFTGRTLNLGVTTPCPVLNVGGIVKVAPRCSLPSFGAAGAYPDVSLARRDGIQVRVRDLAAASSVAVLFVGLDWSGPFVIPGIKGALKTTPVLSMAIPLDGAGEGAMTVPPCTIPLIEVGEDYVFQAATIASGAVRLSNGQKVQF